ncbi:MAG: transglutaminase-like domain-containing protein [Candidatus Levyibacteriota bacterium]
MFKKLFLFPIIVFFFLLIPKQTFAASNFNTDYHITYTIDQSGMAHALVNGTLSNTTSQYYASSYKMQLGFTNISNVQAADAGGAISPLVTKSTDGYEIGLNFNQKAVGLGSQQQFIITFDTPTLARHYGKIWEIDVPGISNPAEFNSFVVELKTPPTFGQPTYIKPKQASSALIFDKQTLGKSGISIAFGDKQNYKFQLAYHIQNPNLYPITTEIALPPATNYQDVAITDLDPAPTNVIEDKDGNWLAQYHLTSAQKLDVVARGNAVIHLTPKQDPLSPDDLKAYLKETKYWEVKNNTIREVSDQLHTPQAIYQYVQNKLHYNFGKVTKDDKRLGALGALQNPNQAVCREFTDLFIALARAAGIPAREVDGYAYTENARQKPIYDEKDILHVWPEYYDTDKKTWVMVDPTWGSTTGGVDYFDTLDFDHFAFVVKGMDSVYPIPAGGYKFGSNPSSKDVDVTFTTDALPDTTPTFETESTIPEVAIAGLPISGKIKIRNTGSSYIPSQFLYLSSKTFSPSEQVVTITGIPPFGTLDVPVKFAATNPLTNTQGDYTIRVAGNATVKHLQSKLFFLTPIGGGISGGVILLLILLGLRWHRK